MNLDRGAVFPDLDLPGHTGRDRLLSEVAAGDPLALLFSRGWWCPKERRHLRKLRAAGRSRGGLHPHRGREHRCPETQSAFRAGLGARFVFLSDADRRGLARLNLLEETDTLHRPYRPTAFKLSGDLTIHNRYDGCCARVVAPGTSPAARSRARWPAGD